jgi:mono/diheme cytochrome c family protein
MNVRRYNSIALAVAIALAPVSASARPDATGFYDGHVADRGTGGLRVASAMLHQAKKAVDGTVTVGIGEAAVEPYVVQGRTRGRRVFLAGSSATGTKLKWRGRWMAGDRLEGKMKLRAPDGTVIRGSLVLVRQSAAPDACSTFFHDAVMGEVLVPVCAQCHVTGGQAGMTRFRVSIDDPNATRQSAAAHIDAADPAGSRLLLKPIGGLGHGGGVRIAPGGAEHLVLEQWVSMVSQGECTAGPTGGGPGGGGPGGGGTGSGGTGADLYSANCASCHGTDARGLPGYPDIHCNKNIQDAVRNGRVGALRTMPAFPNLTDSDIQALEQYLESLCPAGTASGADLYASNCASCHGATGGGGRNAAGVRGPNVRCKDEHDFQEKVRNGDDEMPAFPDIDAAAVSRIVAYIRTFCSGGDD